MEEKKNKKYIIPIVVLVIAIIGLSGVILFKDKLFNKNDNTPKESTTSENVTKSDLKMTSNELTNFDLAFLKLENKEVNKVYSPLSIKYALEMLSEGADGNTKTELDSVIGDYVARKYENGKNMSFANALFIRNSFKDSVNKDYIDTLKNTYNAAVVFDDFKSPKVINDWVNGRTFKLIPELMDDVSDLDYVLVNALAIDMEWKNKIQSEHEDFDFVFANEKVPSGRDSNDPYDMYDYGVWISSLDCGGYTELEFKGYDKGAKAVHIAAVANKYDIINLLGEDEIRDIVNSEYKEWIKDPDNQDIEKYVGKFDIDQYMKDLSGNYEKIDSSTDFYFYQDTNVSVFAKDLKTYNGTTLQYVGIMPRSVNLIDYVKDVDANTVNNLIYKLNPIELSSFEDGYITIVEGYIPLFNYEYELDLMEDLKAIGINDVFDSEKADLSKLSSSETYIDTALHKANIEFSNEGIKAAAATMMGGKGGTGGGFEYLFEVPVKRINLTFDKPYMYIVRDKDTGEVWFTGTVYEPIEYKDEWEEY